MNEIVLLSQDTIDKIAAGEVVEATDSLPKAFILTQEYGMQRVYLTKNSAQVLQKKFEE